MAPAGLRAALALAAAAAARAFDPYFFVPGQLSGFDAPGLPPANITLAAAQALCSASDGCFGVSCETPLPPPDPAPAVPCVFKTATMAAAAPGWASFVRCGVLSPCPPAPPCTAGDWSSAHGFLADGGDALPPGPATFAQAKATCAATAGCLGITFSAPEAQPSGTISTVYYKNQTDEVDDPSWWAWVLCV